MADCTRLRRHGENAGKTLAPQSELGRDLGGISLVWTNGRTSCLDYISLGTLTLFVRGDLTVLCFGTWSHKGLIGDCQSATRAPRLCLSVSDAN